MERCKKIVEKIIIFLLVASSVSGLAVDREGIDFFGKAGVAPNNVLWGVDVWLEDLELKFFKREIIDKYRFYERLAEERQHEIYKCVYLNNSLCVGYAVEEFERRSVGFIDSMRFVNAENLLLTEDTLSFYAEQNFLFKTSGVSGEILVLLEKNDVLLNNLLEGLKRR